MQLTFRRMTSLMKYKPNTHRNTIHSTKLIYIYFKDLKGIKIVLMAIGYQSGEQM